MKSMKRLSAGLLMLALLLTLFAFPAAADNTYSVTLPDGATGPATVAEGEDYTFTLSEDVLIVAYAEFTDGSICAAEAEPIFDNETGAVTGYTRTIPGTLINSDFVIKTFTVETTGNGSFFNKGNGSEEVPYEIDSELALLQLMAASTTSFSGSGDTLTVYDDADKYYVLTEDISFHTPISICLAPHSAGVYGRTQFCQSVLGTTITTATPFSATIDGNNHTLALLNVWVENVDSIMALIPRHSGTVKNLNVTTPNDYLFSDSEIAVNMISVLVGENLSGGMIQNCSVTSNILLDNITFYSGSVSSSYFSLIASKNSGVIDSCKAHGSIQIKSEHSKGVYAGMISGYNYGGTISNCIAEGTVYQSGKSGNNYIGGITGFNQQINNTCKAVISSCINHADVTGTTGTTSGNAYIGGIAGCTQGNAAYPSEIVNCLNDGEVSSLESGGKNEYVGGIAGRALAAGSVVGCYNLGSVSSHGTSNNNFAGGIIGQNNSSAVTVAACFTYVNGQNAIGNVMTKNLSYTFILADETDTLADETSEEVELSAADFKAASLVTALNTALGEEIFVAGTDYPVFSWLAEETPVPEPTVPGAVAEISAEPLDNLVVVNWSEAEGADHYRLARQTTGQSWVLLSGNITGTEYEDTTAVPGRRYRYLVCAENELGKGASVISETITAIGTAAPGAVTSVAVSAQPGKNVVSWSEAEGADHYRLARQTTGQGWILLDDDIAGTSFEDTTAAAGQRYRYLVCAENAGGKGASATSAVVVAQAAGIPSAVTSITAAAQPGKNVITWSEVEGADHYRLARQTTGQGWILLDGNITGTGFEDTTAAAGQRYRYLVCAENGSGKGDSATSAVVVARAVGVPGAVTSVAASAQPGKNVVTWSEAEGADHYRLARQTTGEAWELLDGNIAGTGFEDTTAVPGRRYRYLVCAENGSGKGESATSAVVVAVAAE